VDERCIVNAMVALLATGGSTNHLIHWVAVARGRHPDRLDRLFRAVGRRAAAGAGLPQRQADVNQFQAAGGPASCCASCSTPAACTATWPRWPSGGMAAYGRVPATADGGGALTWPTCPHAHRRQHHRARAAPPFSPAAASSCWPATWAARVIKTSAVPEDRHVVEAPAIVFDSQERCWQAFQAGELERDVVAVVRFQGPQANGMPELHKLTPPLAVLQGKGFRVALVTDGRMSGASGKVPAAIHVSPEALAGGPLAKLRDGDRVRVDAVAGTLRGPGDPAEWAGARPHDRGTPRRPGRRCNAHGLGRELFGGLRRNVRSAEEGAVTWL
jgi:phosphogluconate dehydratase